MRRTMARETGCHVQTHCSESDWEHGYVMTRTGLRDAAALELAHAVRETPGMGGPKWLQAIADAKEKIEKHFATDAKERDKQLQRVDEDLQQWIEIERFNLDASAPGALIRGDRRFAHAFEFRQTQVRKRESADHRTEQIGQRDHAQGREQ